jgi:predicted ATPase
LKSDGYRRFQDVSMLLREIKIKNLLSFGPEGVTLEMRPLNVLIGPNGSGKSNLIEAIALLRSTAVVSSPTSVGDLRDVVRRGGGAAEWIWKAEMPRSQRLRLSAESGGVRRAYIEAIIENLKGRPPLRHVLSFREFKHSLDIVDEQIEKFHPSPGKDIAHFYYRFQKGHPVITVKHKQRPLTRETVDLSESIVGQRRDAETFPEINYLAGAYDGIMIYREWTFGRTSVFRAPQPADLRGAPLQEDFSNLGLFLNYLRGIPSAKSVIIERLRDLYEGLEDFDVNIRGGTVELFLTEGDFVIPAKRLSDGTMRYLCLLAILCDPDPPPLICIEEPELGLHPDLLPKIADLLVEASLRTQLIVTTHSDILVDAMTDHAEDVVVFEKHEGRTEANRLQNSELQAWLEKYRLGQLWTRGQIGGTRW